MLLIQQILILEGEFVAKWVYVLLIVIAWILLATLLVSFVHELINYAIITYYNTV